RLHKLITLAHVQKLGFINDLYGHPCALSSRSILPFAPFCILHSTLKTPAQRPWRGAQEIAIAKGSISGFIVFVSHPKLIYLNTGIFSVPEAARLTRVSTGRIRRWLKGYRYTSREKSYASPP